MKSVRFIYKGMTYEVEEIFKWVCYDADGYICVYEQCPVPDLRHEIWCGGSIWITVGCRIKDKHKLSKWRSSLRYIPDLIKNGDI